VRLLVRRSLRLCRSKPADARTLSLPSLLPSSPLRSSSFYATSSVRCIVIAGSDERFASGAEIASSLFRALRQRPLVPSDGRFFWARIADCGSRLVAAVVCWALGRAAASSR